MKRSCRRRAALLDAADLPSRGRSGTRRSGPVLRAAHSNSRRTVPRRSRPRRRRHPGSSQSVEHHRGGMSGITSCHAFLTPSTTGYFPTNFGFSPSSTTAVTPTTGAAVFPGEWRTPPRLNRAGQQHLCGRESTRFQTRRKSISDSLAHCTASSRTPRMERPSASRLSRCGPARRPRLHPLRGFDAEEAKALMEDIAGTWTLWHSLEPPVPI